MIGAYVYSTRRRFSISNSGPDGQPSKTKRGDMSFHRIDVSNMIPILWAVVLGRCSVVERRDTGSEQIPAKNGTGI
jgi:hypothetical protein